MLWQSPMPFFPFFFPSLREALLLKRAFFYYSTQPPFRFRVRTPEILNDPNTDFPWTKSVWFPSPRYASPPFNIFDKPTPLAQWVSLPISLLPSLGIATVHSSLFSREELHLSHFASWPTCEWSLPASNEWLPFEWMVPLRDHFPVFHNVSP